MKTLMVVAIDGNRVYENGLVYDFGTVEGAEVVDDKSAIPVVEGGAFKITHNGGFFNANIEDNGDIVNAAIEIANQHSIGIDAVLITG